jgi:putative transcriptional regulator
MFMHPADIAAALKRRGLSQSDVARELQISRPSVGDIIHGRGRSARVERVIADKLGLPLYVIWPQHYKAPEDFVGLREQNAIYGGLDGLETMLLQMFRSMDAATKLRMLTLATEMAGAKKGSTSSTA